MFWSIVPFISVSVIFVIGRFYARDVKVVKTHLTSETLKRSGIKTGRINVDKQTDKNKIFLKKMIRLYYRKTLGKHLGRPVFILDAFKRVVRYTDIMRFIALHNRHHKVSPNLNP